jgi:AcrR family transcriptional regulator
MSPYPSQLNPARIVDAARAMIEVGGVDGLSLHRLADALGVKAPSLYRYFRDRAELLRAVNESTTRALFVHIDAALGDAPDDPAVRLMIVAQAYRAFAHANPAAYGLLFTNTILELRPDAAQQEQMVLPLQALMAQLSGEANSLPALRGVWALIHGFVTLELNGQFQRGGDLVEAFEKSIRICRVDLRTAPNYER